MTWRYNASAKIDVSPSTSNIFASLKNSHVTRQVLNSEGSGLFEKNSDNISGAGAFLRRHWHSQPDIDQQGSDEKKEEEGPLDNDTEWMWNDVKDTNATDESLSRSCRIQPPVRSLGGAIMSNLAVRKPTAAGERIGGDGKLTNLFKGTILSSARRFLDENDADKDGEGNDNDYNGRSDEGNVLDRDFFRNVKALFSEVDQELLSENFVPYDYVVEIISDDNNKEVSEKDIDEQLVVFYELQADLDEILGDYIENHYGEFNAAIAGFSEIVLAVSGSDEMLARLKQRLIMATASLENCAGQLQMLRVRAAKAFLMTELLKKMEASLSCESEVKQLIAARRYLAAVRLLQQHKVDLEVSEVVDINATHVLHKFVTGTLSVMHTTVIDDLMNCVFRQEQLMDWDTRQVERMLEEGISVRVRNAINALATLGDEMQVNHHDRNVGSTLLALMEDSDNNWSEKDGLTQYLRFVPMCVKALQELRQLDRCYEAFLSTTTRSIEQTIIRFLRLYQMWRRREIGSASASRNPDTTTVQAIKLQARDLTSRTISYEEAIALVQESDLRAMLNALFVELERIVRNAEYLVRVVLTAHFSFLSTHLMQSVMFDPDQTLHEWNIANTPLQDAEELRGIVAASFTELLSKHGRQLQEGHDSPAMEALKGLMSRLDYRSALLIKEGTSANDACLQSVLNAIDAATQAVLRDFPQEPEGMIMQCHAELCGSITTKVRHAFHRDVRDMLAQWDLQVLSSQIEYYMELIFHVLCDAGAEAEGVGDDVALKPFLKNSNLIRRVQQTVARRSSSAVDTFISLDKMLSAQNSSGILTMMQETGCVSFSLLTAVKHAQLDLRGAVERDVRLSGSDVVGVAEARKITSITSNTNGASGSGGLLVSREAAMLKRWFVLTPVNVLACYECTCHFYQRCSEHTAQFANARCLGVDGFFYRFLQKTYVPTVYVFYLQQLRSFFSEILDMENSSEDITTLNGGNQRPSLASVSSSMPFTGSLNKKIRLESIRWPTITLSLNGVDSNNEGSSGRHLLTCVYYVGQVVQKTSKMWRELPDSFAEMVYQSITEGLLIELVEFLKTKLQFITHGSIHYYLLNDDFEKAFDCTYSQRWQTLCDTTHLLDCHDIIDGDLFQYYLNNNEQRTSGRQYNHVDRRKETNSYAGKFRSNNEKDINTDISSTPPSELALKGDGVIVALALLCHSIEWLCSIFLRATGVNAMDGCHCLDYNNCLLPGTVFLSLEECWISSSSSTVTHRKECWQRLDSILRKMYTLSQLRDESYNIVATACTADTFVRSYNRRITNFFALLKPYLTEKKLKYIGITVVRPLSDLILMEIAHLRNKVISPAGSSKLKVNLLAMETALQLILPADDELRNTVKYFLTRPATFLRYLHNKDVAHELVTSGDYRYFTMWEMEELVRLVFCMETNNETCAQQIQILHEKLRCISRATPRLKPSPSPMDSGELQVYLQEASKKGDDALESPVEERQKSKHIDPIHMVTTLSPRATQSATSVGDERTTSTGSDEFEFEEETHHEQLKN